MSTYRPVFPAADFKSHMPFFDGRWLLFCRARAPRRHDFLRTGSIWQSRAQDRRLARGMGDLPRTSLFCYRPWKVCWCDWRDRQPLPIATGLPETAIECNPSFYRDGDAYCVTFVGGVPGESCMEYAFYEMRGRSLSALGPARQVPDMRTRLGFVSPRHVCTGSGAEVSLTERVGGRQTRVRFPLARLYRVSFRSDRTEQILATGQDAQGRHRTMLYAIDTRQAWEVLADGPVYKASLCGRRLVFARCGSADFEDRQLWHGPYRLLPLEGPVQPREM